MKQALPKSRHNDESGAEELRRVVALCNLSTEACFDDLTTVEVVRLARAVWSSEWDCLPDHLTDAERKYAARTGKMPKSAERRFERDGGPS